MATLTASKARTKLYRLIDDAWSTHAPIVITGKPTNAVLVSEEDWNALQDNRLPAFSPRNAGVDP